MVTGAPDSGFQDGKTQDAVTNDMTPTLPTRLVRWARDRVTIQPYEVDQLEKVDTL